MRILNNKWYGLSIRVIALFATAMLVSYSPMFLRGFFEDTPNLPDQFGRVWGKGIMDGNWDWGYRHYLYFYMCVVLFFIQGVRICKWIEKNRSEFK